MTIDIINQPTNFALETPYDIYISAVHQIRNMTFSSKNAEIIANKTIKRIHECSELYPEDVISIINIINNEISNCRLDIGIRRFHKMLLSQY